MLTTKRYDYVFFQEIGVHPHIANHRALDLQKVSHYQKDILKNGLLEPLIVWERKGGEYFLVGGFHRLEAIKGIRTQNPGYFDRVDVRVVAGELDEIRALNLKLNSDRLDTKITDYFDTVIYLNNANWAKEKIAEFLGKKLSWVEEILRFAPGIDPKVREHLDKGTLSWNRAKGICRKVLEAPPGEEKEALERELEALKSNGSSPKPKKPLTFRNVKKRLYTSIKADPQATYVISSELLLSLLLVIEGKEFEENHLEQVKKTFPMLLPGACS